MFLNTKNITTIKPLKKLDYKIIRLFKVTKNTGENNKLELLNSIKLKHNIFHSLLLRKALDNLLLKQVNKFSSPVEIEKEDEWEVNNILNTCVQ